MKDRIKQIFKDKPILRWIVPFIGIMIFYLSLAMFGPIILMWMIGIMMAIFVTWLLQSIITYWVDGGWNL
jgi:hypothetical protein